jgi:TRAP-type mannitol/chloroaromatic compound transport system permease small subunit
MRLMLAASRAIDQALERISATAGWLFVVLTAVICLDVVTRKFGFQLSGMGSTRLQELEWHLHAAIFSFWLGYAYVRNAHVRIDIFTSEASPRAKAILEVLGCLLLALPFSIVALVYLTEYAWIAWIQNESSASITGLPYRFILKAVIAFGFLLLTLSIVSALARSIVCLVNPAALGTAGGKPADGR